MTMNAFTPVRKGLGGSHEGKQQLSSGLKERLKRCGRYHSTPPSAKRPCLTAQREQELSSNSGVLTASPVLSASSSNKANHSISHTSENNSTTPKPLSKSCTRKAHTSLSFQSPILKPMNSCEKTVSSDSPSGSPLPSVSLSSTPLSSKCSQYGRKVGGRNKNKLFDTDSDISDNKDGDEVVRHKRELKELKSSLAGLEEKLRKLKMVKMYRSKNNLDELQTLIDKWRGVSQEAVTDLHQLLPEPRPSLSDFVNHLQIDTELVQLHLEEEED